MPWAPVSESYSLTEIKLHRNQGALSNASSHYTRSGLYDGYFTKALSQEEGSGKQTTTAQLHAAPLYLRKNNYSWESPLRETAEICFFTAHEAELSSTGCSHG